MKMMIVWLKKDGKCRCWTNASKIEQAVMSLVSLKTSISRMAAEDHIPFNAAWENLFKTVNKDKAEREEV